MGFAYFGNMAPKFGFVVTAFVLCNVINQILAQDDANGVKQADESGIIIASFDYNMDICNFLEITPQCKTDYVITAVKIQRLNPGSCGCFRQDMEVALYGKCIGTSSCAFSFEELKVDTTVYPLPPTEFCWLTYRIIYTCEPARSLCQGDGADSVSIFGWYASHVNLISPDYPKSYPGTPEARPQLVCGSEISVSKRDGTPLLDSEVTITQTDLSLPMYQFVALCGGNILHVGVRHDKLGPDMWDNCVGSAQKFAIGTPMHIFYHYNYDFSYHRGVILKIQASDENAIIRVKYANNPEEGPDTVSTISPLEKFNIPGQKKNFPIDTNPSENYNSTNNDTPTTQDILQGSFLTLVLALSGALLLLIILIVLTCLCRRRHTSSHAACGFCCKPNEAVETEGSPQLKGIQGSAISPYACSEIIPMTGYPRYENQCRVPENGYVNTRDRPARYSSKIPSAIYDDIEGQVGNSYETHILPNCAGWNEEQENVSNETTGPNSSHVKSDKTRNKSDDGYDSNSGSSIALQEGETLLIENDLYDSKS